MKIAAHRHEGKIKRLQHFICSICVNVKFFILFLSFSFLIPNWITKWRKICELIPGTACPALLLSFKYRYHCHHRVSIRHRLGMPYCTIRAALFGARHSTARTPNSFPFWTVCPWAHRALGKCWKSKTNGDKMIMSERKSKPNATRQLTSFPLRWLILRCPYLAISTFRFPSWPTVWPCRWHSRSNPAQRRQNENVTRCVKIIEGDSRMTIQTVRSCTFRVRRGDRTMPRWHSHRMDAQHCTMCTHGWSSTDDRSESSMGSDVGIVSCIRPLLCGLFQLIGARASETNDIREFPFSIGAVHDTHRWFCHRPTIRPMPAKQMNVRNQLDSRRRH